MGVSLQMATLVVKAKHLGNCSFEYCRAFWSSETGQERNGVMIAVTGAFGDAAECCNGCGADLQGKHICYWERSRVCTACYEDLAEGDRRIKAAERFGQDRSRQAVEDDEQMEASRHWESNSLVSVLSAFALLGLLGLFWYLAVLGAVHFVGDLVDL